MLLLIFTNIFIYIQQPNLHSRNIFIHIYLCISYSRLYLLTLTRCLHSHSTSYIHSLHIHDRNIHSTFSAHHLCASVTIKHGLRTTDYGLRTTDWVKHGLRYKRRTKHYGLGIKYGLKYKTRTVRYGLGIKHEERFYKLNKFSHERL